LAACLLIRLLVTFQMAIQEFKLVKGSVCGAGYCTSNAGLRYPAPRNYPR